MNNSITAIIIDDEKDARDGLAFLISENIPEIQVLEKIDNAEEGLQKIISIKPEIVFLDVEMPGKSGLDLMKDLKLNQVETTIFFVTAFNEYAIDAIKFAAFDYILKPVDIDELKIAINRYKCEKKKQNLNDKIDLLYSKLNARKIKLLSRNKYIFIDPNDIVYCEADGNYCFINLIDETQEYVTMQLGKLEKVIQEDFLVRASRTFLINMNYITEINPKNRSVKLQFDDNEIELSASRQGMNKLSKQCS
ncbi:MAG: LytTR family DNA-binding domain-containing protein [Bacteroidetes bacterium]|nr:LytTR family DNA-binding domain-containing protein [Bacteroidota bacterium]